MQEKSTSSIVRTAVKYGSVQGAVSIGVLLAWTLTGMKQSWMLTVIASAPLIALMILAHQEIKSTHAGLMTYPQGLGSGTLL